MFNVIENIFAVIGVLFVASLILGLIVGHFLGFLASTDISPPLDEEDVEEDEPIVEDVETVVGPVVEDEPRYAHVLPLPDAGSPLFDELATETGFLEDVLR